MLGVSKAAISHEDDDGGERSHDVSARSIASRTSGCRSSRVISARAVERVVGISRKAVDAYVTAIAAKLDLPLRRPMARLAQALQFASDELSPVAPMRHDVVYHARRRHDPALQTELAQRMLRQLELTQPSPASGFIEVLPRNRVTADSRHQTRPVAAFSSRTRTGLLLAAAIACRGLIGLCQCLTRGQFHRGTLQKRTQVQLRPWCSIGQKWNSAITFLVELPRHDCWGGFTALTPPAR